MVALILAVALDLTTAAQASPRPPECRGASSAEGGWVRTRGADAQRYCELLARGYARLPLSPQEALLSARAAEALAGPLPAVRVLSGRANLRLGEPALAYRLFETAERDDTRAFADPQALHDYARAASLAGKPLEAVRLYRLLVTRLTLFDDPRERAFVQIEAAAHVLAHVPQGVDEALGYLSRVRQQSLGLSAWIDALRLLALQRSGRSIAQGSNIARPTLAALGMPPLSTFSADFVVLPPGMFETLSALLERAPLAPAPSARPPHVPREEPSR